MDNTITQADLEQAVQQMNHHLAVRQAQAAVRDQAQKQIDEATAAIKGLLLVLGVKRYESPEWVANFITQNRESISKTKLMAKGISADLIVECTEVNPVEQLRVTKK